MLDKAQIGFQENARTSDHILTLITIINKYVTDQKGKKLYSCLIDLKKSFDGVWHIGLFRKHSMMSDTLACSERLKIWVLMVIS